MLPLRGKVWFNIAVLKNAGSEGIGRVIEKLLSIRVTEAMVYQLHFFEHGTLVWMHLIVLVVESAFNLGSTRFEAVTCFQFVHAYKII